MASRHGSLPFDDAPRTKVFRAIDDLIRGDRNLAKVLSDKGAVRSWRGQPEDKMPFAITQGVALRLTPVPQEENQFYPGATKGDLVVMFEILVAGLAVDDVENLFHAIQRVLVPRGEQDAVIAVHNKLKAAGATTGIITFTQPAHDASPEAGTDGQFRATGALKLEVTTT